MRSSAEVSLELRDERRYKESRGVLTKPGFSSSPFAMEPPVSPAAPTSRTLVRDMMVAESGNDS